MKCIRLFVLAVLASLFSQICAADTDVLGAGSSLSANLMMELSRQYRSGHDIDVSYKSVGSGEGVRRMAARAIDFALTDIPLSDYEVGLLDAIEFPVFFTGVVPFVNLPGLEGKSLVLDGTVLAQIYLGKTTRWNDPQIRALNPGLNLPDEKISVYFRGDSSGTSYVFSRFLSDESRPWSELLGVGSRLPWPNGVPVNGTAAMIPAVVATRGAIGYADFGDAARSGLAMVNLKTSGGRIAVPSHDSFKNSASNIRWERTGCCVLPKGRNAASEWPMLATTYALFKRKAAHTFDMKQTLDFFNWLLLTAAPHINTLNFVPVQSKALLPQIYSLFGEIRDENGAAIFLPAK